MRTRNDGTAVSWLFATLNFFKPSPHHLVSHDSQNLNCVTSLLRDPQCHPVVLIIKLPVLPPLVRCDTIGPRPALLTCLLALPSLTCFLLHEEVTLIYVAGPLHWPVPVFDLYFFSITVPLCQSIKSSSFVFFTAFTSIRNDFFFIFFPIPEYMLHKNRPMHVSFSARPHCLEQNLPDLCGIWKE